MHFPRQFALLALFVQSATVAMAADAAPQPDEQGWYSLFNGEDLTGWKVNENPGSFRVENGELIVNGDRGHAFYVGPVNGGKFEDLEWKCEILTKPQANSGMYFHTKYQPSGWPAHGIEVQVNNSHPDPRKTGSVYGLKDVMNDSPASDNEWFTQHVIVKGNHITVLVDGEVVNEYTQPEDLQRDKGWEHNLIGSGSLALQAHDPGSEVRYRKIMVKPLP